MGEPLRVRREGALVRATLDRPPVNALDAGTYRRLAEVAAGARPAECLLIDATGRAFSAGQDLREHERSTAAGRLGESLTVGAGALTAVLHCPAPVVVAVREPRSGPGRCSSPRPTSRSSPTTPGCGCPNSTSGSPSVTPY